MKVVITINGEDFMVTIPEAQNIVKQIHEQIYTPAGSNDESKS